MPGFDGTGPLGQGPFTGRGRGFCVMKLPQGMSLPGRGPMAESRQQTEDDTEKGKEAIAMPAGDGTGPFGLGPMTGRAAGYCAGYPVPGYMNPVFGRGFLARPFVGAYGPVPYSQGMVPYGAGWPYGYGAGYIPFWGRPFGRFGRGRGRGFGRGWRRAWW
jgi:hypothetical protein